MKIYFDLTIDNPDGVSVKGTFRRAGHSLAAFGKDAAVTGAEKAFTAGVPGERTSQVGATPGEDHRLMLGGTPGEDGFLSKAPVPVLTADGNYDFAHFPNREFLD